MDKFGIFNILSSLFNFYKRSNDESGGNIFNQGGQESPQNFGNIKEILNLFAPKKSNGETPSPAPDNHNNFSENFAENKREREEPSAPPAPNKISLKNRLLSTSISHDEFVKRVNKNAGNKV